MIFFPLLSTVLLNVKGLEMLKIKESNMKVNYISESQNYDGIVGDVTITGNRTLYADFTVTYTDLGIGTITKRESNDIWLFSRPLHPNLWLTIAAFLVLIGLVVWVIEHSSNKEFQGSVAHQIGTMLWFGFSTLFYAHSKLSDPDHLLLVYFDHE